MNIKFEDYFEKNREKLDTQTSNNDYLWKKINRNTRTKQYKTWYLGAAAAVVILLMGGMLFRHEQKINHQGSELATIHPEVGNTEAAYIKQVNAKWKEYNEMGNQQSPVTQDLLEELERLDTLYQNGLNELKQNGYNERAITILLNTYEKRLRILDRLINEKQKQENYENRTKQVEL